MKVEVLNIKTGGSRSKHYAFKSSLTVKEKYKKRLKVIT
jgi:hypothetical protein